MGETLPYGDVLIGVAQVAIVFAGFAGISVVLSRRMPEHWSYGEAVRMACMIESSLSAAFFALLPFAFVSFGATVATTWSVSGLIFAVVMFVHMIANARRMQLAYQRDPADRLPIWFRASMALIGGILVIALVLNSFNVLFDRSFGPYFAGLLFHMAFSSLMFMRSLTLIRDTARSS